MSTLVVDAVDATFQQEVIKSPLPVLVDFWATWCQPCKALSPIIEELAQTYAGQIKFVKFNVESGIQTPQQYAVTSLPRLLVFRNGVVVRAIPGTPSKAKLEEEIKKLVDVAVGTC